MEAPNPCGTRPHPINAEVSDWEYQAELWAESKLPPEVREAMAKFCLNTASLCSFIREHLAACRQVNLAVSDYEYSLTHPPSAHKPIIPRPVSDWKPDEPLTDEGEEWDYPKPTIPRPGADWKPLEPK